VDLDALARAQRRQWALDALEFERSREAALREQLSEVSVELEGPRIDAEAFARLSPDDVEVIRSALTGRPAEDLDLAERSSQTSLTDDEVTDEAAERQERLREIERLGGEIETCRLRQRAFERFLTALSAAHERAES
jgi:hypothetical protein